MSRKNKSNQNKSNQSNENVIKISPGDEKVENPVSHSDNEVTTVSDTEFTVSDAELKPDRKYETLENKVNNLTDQLAAAFEKLNAPARKERVDYESEEKSLVGKHDWMDEAKVYFAYSKSWSLHGHYIKAGVKYDPPMDIPIKFTTHYRYSAGTLVKGTKSERLISTCRFITHSRSLSDWLEAHPLFSIKFFMLVGQAEKSSINAFLAEKRTKAADMVNGYAIDYVVQRAKEYQIPLTDDQQLLRVQLIDKIADSLIKSDPQHPDNQQDRILETTRTQGGSVVKNEKFR